MARVKKTQRCYTCGIQFTWEKGSNDANGNFVYNVNGAVRKLEVATGKIHYCKGKASDNIERDYTKSEYVRSEAQTIEQASIEQASQAIESLESSEQAIEQATKANDYRTDAKELLSDAGLAIFNLIEPALEARISDVLKDFKPRTNETRIVHTIEVKNSDGTVTVIDGAHAQTATMLRYLRLGKNVLLVGPAGSGKTHAASVAADALGLNYYPQSVGPQTSKSDLIGYMDAHGKLVRTPAREAYEHGGVWLIDEIDAANASVLTIVNMMLSNSHASFPDGTIKRHANFRVIASANTYGNGANRMYVGRNQLDAATLDRFVGIDWNYDNDLERKLCADNPEWLAYIWKLRATQERLKIRVVLSLRAIIDGNDMLSAGIAWPEVEAARLWFGVSSDDKAKLIAGSN